MNNGKDKNVKVIGLWEFGWNCPLQESWLWTFVLREFGVMDWFMAPITGIIHNETYSGIDLVERNTIKELLDLEENKDYKKVYVDECGETELSDFSHPEKAIYIFGCAGNSPLKMHKKDEDFSVKIGTIKNSGVLWPHQCLLLTLYDRLKKGK